VKAGYLRCDPQLIISLAYFYYHIYFQLLVELHQPLDILEPRRHALVHAAQRAFSLILLLLE
jgi:hypothetical protein